MRARALTRARFFMVRGFFKLTAVYRGKVADVEGSALQMA